MPWPPPTNAATWRWWPLIRSPPTWWSASATPDDYSNPAFHAQIDANAFKVGDTFRAGFGDYIALKPGKDGTVLVKGADGYPALVAGTAGKGKAVLSGLALGQDEKAAARMAEGDGKLLRNAVYWLVEK